MPVLEELPLDRSRITIPRQLQLELDNTRELGEENLSRITFNNRPGSRSIRINTTMDININIHPRRSIQETQPIIRPLIRSRSHSNYEASRLAEIPKRSQLVELQPNTLKIDLTQPLENFILLEITKEGKWIEIIALINPETSKSIIQLEYTDNNIEINEEDTIAQANIRFNHRDIIKLKLFVEPEIDNNLTHKIILGQDFLDHVTRYRI